MAGIEKSRAGNISDIVSLKEFFAHELEGLRHIIDERDRLYSTQFKASETAVNAALMAQQQAVKDAFLAAEKAIAKSERSQEEYNNRSEEYRSQLNAHTQTLMPRAETLGLFLSVSDKFVFVQTAIESKLDTQGLSNEKVFDGFRAELKSLRESRDVGAGRASEHSVNALFTISIINIILIFLTIAVTVVIKLLS